MKKSKLITSLCTLVLTLACLTFGVYSAVKTSFTASGSITFNAYSLEIDVKCTITGAQGGTKTIYGTTFTDGTARENYTSTSGRLDGVVDLSASGATLALGDLAFDELNETNLINIRFDFTNYSDYVVKAEGVMSLGTGASKAVTSTYGGSAIMNKYSSSDSTDTGFFELEMKPSGTTKTDSSNNTFAVAVSISPEGLKTSSDSTKVYDITVCKPNYEESLLTNMIKSLAEGEYSSYPEIYSDYLESDSEYVENGYDGMGYIISSTEVEALPRSFSYYDSLYYPVFKDDLIYATTVFGKPVTKISVTGDEDWVDQCLGGSHKNLHYSKSVKTLSNYKWGYIPEGIENISASCFRTNYDPGVIEVFEIPTSVKTIGDYAFLAMNTEASMVQKVYIRSSEIAKQLTSKSSCGNLVDFLPAVTDPDGYNYVGKVYIEVSITDIGAFVADSANFTKTAEPVTYKNVQYYEYTRVTAG